MPIAGVGAQFLRWNTGTSAWDVISRVQSISGPTKSRGTIDVTSLDSTGGYREFITGFRDAGTVTLNMLFERDEYETLNNDFEDETAQNYQIVLPDDDVTSLSFEGLVTEIPLNIPTDAAVGVNVTIKLSGEVTLESGSAGSPA